VVRLKALPASTEEVAAAVEAAAPSRAAVVLLVEDKPDTEVRPRKRCWWENPSIAVLKVGSKAWTGTPSAIANTEPQA
jgi:hypothetical protein